MAIFSEINFIAVLVATIASFAFGTVWYMALQKPWMKYTGITEAKMKNSNMAKNVAIALLGTLIMSSVLAIFVPDVFNINTALFLGFLLWLGLLIPTELSGIAWEQRAWQLLLINGIFQLLNIFLIITIVHSWPW